MIQIKKKIFSLFFMLIIIFSMTNTIKASEINEKISTDVGQKSIIDEQLITNPYTLVINSLTEKEKELICRITWLEAGNQSIEGQKAVIEVILNRLISVEWENNIEDILSSPHQFSTWKNRNIVTQEQIIKMNNVLNLVYLEQENTLPNFNYVYFNNKKPNRKNFINIGEQWFWT